MNLIEIICTPFSYIVSAVNNWTGSYLLALLAFTLVMKLVFFPFAMKQQKNSVKQAALRPKEEAIRAKYAGRTDKPTQQKMQQEVMEMYQEEKFSPLSGCMPMLIQLPLLIILYNIVRQPLMYTVRYSTEEIDALNQAMAISEYYDARSALEGAKGELELKKEDGKLIFRDPADGKYYLVKHNETDKLLEFYVQNEDGTYSEKALRFEKKNPYVLAASDAADKDVVAGIPAYPLVEGKVNQLEQSAMISELKNNETKYETLYTTVVEGEEGKYSTAEELDLASRLPKFSYFGGAIDLGQTASFKNFNWLLIIPLLTFITSYGSQWLTRKFTYQPQTTAESQSSMRMMNVMMPLMSVWITFMVPSALAIYWILQNLITPLQQILLAKMYPVPKLSDEELKKAKDEYVARQKGKVDKKTIPAPKRRSLVYDDDDDIPEVEEEVEVPAFEQAAEEKETPIGKAELKGSSSKHRKPKK